jgi:hypothetical protein
MFRGDLLAYCFMANPSKSGLMLVMIDTLPHHHRRLIRGMVSRPHGGIRLLVWKLLLRSGGGCGTPVDIVPPVQEKEPNGMNGDEGMAADDATRQEIENLKREVAVQAATQAGQAATMAATQAGQAATTAAAQAGTAATNAAAQAGTVAMVVAGAVALIVGMFLGLTIARVGNK